MPFALIFTCLYIGKVWKPIEGDERNANNLVVEFGVTTVSYARTGARAAVFFAPFAVII